MPSFEVAAIVVNFFGMILPVKENTLDVFLVLFGEWQEGRWLDSLGSLLANTLRRAYPSLITCWCRGGLLLSKNTLHKCKEDNDCLRIFHYPGIHSRSC